MKKFLRPAAAFALFASLGVGAYVLVQALSQAPTQNLAASRRLDVPMIYAQATSLADGTFTGNAVNAFYGTVQVELVVQNGKVTTARVLQYPSDNGTSRYINSVALPYLIKDTVQSQGSQYYLVSGATFTSQAFAQSFKSALTQAGG